MMEIKNMVDSKKIKAGAAALLFVKIFGIGKSLMFILGGALGFLAARRLGSMDMDKDED